VWVEIPKTHTHPTIVVPAWLVSPWKHHACFLTTPKGFIASSHAALNPFVTKIYPLDYAMSLKFVLGDDAEKRRFDAC